MDERRHYKTLQAALVAAVGTRWMYPTLLIMPDDEAMGTILSEMATGHESKNFSAFDMFAVRMVLSEKLVRFGIRAAVQYQDDIVLYYPGGKAKVVPAERYLGLLV